MSVSENAIPHRFASNTPTVILPAPGIPISIKFCLFFNGLKLGESFICRVKDAALPGAERIRLNANWNYYVDKTHLLGSLVDRGKYFFLIGGNSVTHAPIVHLREQDGYPL